MTGVLFQFFLGLLGALLLLYSRMNVLALPFFFMVFFVMVLQAIREKRVLQLVIISGLASLVLTLRFPYLTWGDPWSEYAMILRLLEHGTLAKEVYPSQQPAMHLSIAALAMITHIDPMSLQKFVAPLFSVLTIIFLYQFARNYFGDRELGFFAGLLLLVGTPYLHWTTQAVRESMGLPMLLMSFYFSYKAVKSGDISNLRVSIVLIAGLILTHNFSAVIFIGAWFGFSLAYSYLHGKSKTSIISLTIMLFAVVAAMAWWSATEAPYDNFVIALSLFLPGNPVVSFTIFAIALYALPYKSPKLIKTIRRSTNDFLENQAIRGLIVGIAVFSAFIAVELVRGKSFLVLNYPASMMFNGFVMILLSLLGLNLFLNLRGAPILAWIGAVAFPMVISTFQVIPFGDPLRFMEYLYMPLAIIAGAGLKRIYSKSPKEWMAGVVAGAVTISLGIAFPPVVFWGAHFEKGDILYDDRGWVIYHTTPEIKAIEWLGREEINGNLFTDNYVYYAAQWLSDDVLKDNRMRLGPIEQPGNNYIILTERMQSYAEFSEGMMRERRPLQGTEIENLNKGASLIYDAGEAKIYYTRG